MAKAADLKIHFGSHFSQEVRRGWIEMAGEHEVLPDEQAALVAELVEVGGLVDPPAPDAEHVAVEFAGQIEHLGGTGIDTEFESEGDLSGIDPDTQLVIYRVSQESIGNAVRHSQADRIRVELNRGPSQVELTVRDDGTGFSFDEANSGLGLGGMRERALLVGGELDVQSRPGEGTTVRLVVPDQETANDGMAD